MSLFTDDSGEYQLLDYSPTHNQLLIRSIRNKQRDHNIDIIFKPVRRMLIAGSWRGVDISVAGASAMPAGLTTDFDLISVRDYKVFVIREAEGKRYYVNAMAFGVYHNSLDILETSLGRYDRGDLGEKILWFNG